MNPRPRKLLFASFGCSVHDRRFLLNAVSGGYDVVFMRFDGNGTEGEPDNRPESVGRVEWIGDQKRLCEENYDEFCENFQTVVRSVGPDVIHAGPLSSVASVAVQIRDVPVVAMSWAFDVLRDYEESPFARRCVELCLEKAPAFVADCSTVMKRLQSLGSDRRPVVVLPWGIDLSEFTYVPPQNRFLGLRVLNLRSWEPGYSVHELLDAFAEKRELLGNSPRLVMAGGGSLELELRSRAKSLGLAREVEWLGRVGESEVQKQLAECDVHVSTSPVDGTSVSLLQAMAVGRPSVVCDNSSNREWVTQGSNGWLFGSGGDLGLGEALVKAFTEAERRLSFGIRCRSIVERRANWESNRLALLSLYDELVGS